MSIKKYKQDGNLVQICSQSN